MDITAVYEAAQMHMLTAICAMSLESSGVKDEGFTQAMAKAVRKNVQFDIDRAQILEHLEKAGIWYMPLKAQCSKSCTLSTVCVRCPITISSLTAPEQKV